MSRLLTGQVKCNGCKVPQTRSFRLSFHLVVAFASHMADYGFGRIQTGQRVSDHYSKVPRPVCLNSGLNHYVCVLANMLIARRRTPQKTAGGPSPARHLGRCTFSATPCDSLPRLAPLAGRCGGCCEDGSRSSHARRWWHGAIGRSGSPPSLPPTPDPVSPPG